MHPRLSVRALLVQLALITCSSVVGQEENTACGIAVDQWDPMEKVRKVETEFVLVHHTENYRGTFSGFYEGGLFGGLESIKNRPEVKFLIAVGDRGGSHQLMFKAKYKNFRNWFMSKLMFRLSDETVLSWANGSTGSKHVGGWDHWWVYYEIPEEDWAKLRAAPLVQIRIYHDHGVYSDLQIEGEARNTFTNGVKCLAERLNASVTTVIVPSTSPPVVPPAEPKAHEGQATESSPPAPPLTEPTPPIATLPAPAPVVSSTEVVMPTEGTASEPSAADTPFNTSVSPGTERPDRSAAPVLAPRPKVIAMVTKKNVDDLNLLVDSLWKAAQENERLVWEHSARITGLREDINAYAERFMWQEDQREALAIRYKQCCRGGGSASPQTLVGVPTGSVPLPAGMAASYTVLHAFSDAAALDTFRIMTTSAQPPQHFLEIISASGRRIYKEEVFTGDIKLSGKPHEGTAAEWDALRLRGMLSPWAFGKPMPVALQDQFFHRARLGLEFEVNEAQVEALLLDPTAVTFAFEAEPGHARLLAYDRTTGKVVDLAPIEP